MTIVDSLIMNLLTDLLISIIVKKITIFVCAEVISVVLISYLGVLLCYKHQTL